MYRPDGIPILAYYQAIIFDLDKTLMIPASNPVMARDPFDRMFIPDREAHVAGLYSNYRIKTAICTNQGGAAFGYFQPNDMDRALRDFAHRLNVQAYAVCYEHPDGTVPALATSSLRRKPEPGMLYELIAALQVESDYVLYVGDRDEDQEAARRAHIDFIWDHVYFTQVMEEMDAARRGF